MRALIVDDQAVFRRGVMETLAEAFSMVTFGEARTTQEALEQVRLRDWDVLILDIGNSRVGRFDILDELKRLRPQLPILVLGMHAKQFAWRALEAGAAGYLFKDCVPEELNDAIKKVLR